MNNEDSANPDLNRFIKNIMEADIIEDDYNYHAVEIYVTLKEIYKDIVIDKKNFFLVVIKAIEMIETVKGLTGLEKKTIVVDALKEIIKNLDIDDELEKELLNKSIDSIIETIIDASRNKFKYNNKKTKKVEKKTVSVIVNELVNKLVNMIDDGSIEPIQIIANTASIVGTLINVVDNYPYLTKIEKKEVIIQAILKFVKENLPNLIVLSPDEKTMLDIAIYIVPQIVDGIFAINDKEFFINIKNNNIIKKYICCCCY